MCFSACFSRPPFALSAPLVTTSIVICVSSNGLKELALARLTAAPCSSKYLTIRRWPLCAAMCKGVFFRFWVYSFTSCPSLSKILTMSRSPSLHDFQMSMDKLNYKG